MTCTVGVGICEREYTGNCCFDTNCAAEGRNFVCLYVNNINYGFCDPELLCGPLGNQVCCNVGQTCVDETCVP